MSVKIVMQLTGDRKLLATFRKLPPAVLEEVSVAIRETTQAVERGAKMRAPVSKGAESRKAKYRPGPGELRDTIRSNVSTSEFGAVGYVSAGYGKLRRRVRGTNARSRKVSARRRAAGAQQDRGVYAMVVEYGSPREHKAAEPFLRPALKAESPRHQQRMIDAVDRGNRKASAGNAA